MTHLLLELSRNFAILKSCKCVAISEILGFEFLAIFNRFWSQNTEKPINCKNFSTFMPPFCFLTEFICQSLKFSLQIKVNE